MDVLVRRVLAQPSDYKGWYKALEALLPKVGLSAVSLIYDTTVL